MVENKSIKNIAVALGQFQSKCPTINKNTKGYGYKYADLPYIIKTITPILKDCNLSFTQLVGGDNGNVSVNISKQDYLDYKEDLAFEQLCNSLSDVIIKFIELHVSGREIRIIDKMDNLKIGIFS